MRIEQGTQKSKIITDNPEILSALYDRLSFRQPGAEYTPAYRARSWDGKKHFITRNGVFRSGLLDLVTNLLVEAGCTFNTEFKGKLLKCAPNKVEIPGLSYYPYQWEAIQDSKYYRRMVVKSPTGSGKTIIMAGIYLNLGEPQSVFLFNKKQLARQTYEFFVDNGIEDVGICTGEDFIYAKTMFCTVQSIGKILDTHLTCKAIFVDECHEFCNGETTLGVIQSFPEADYRFGFSATPPKEKYPIPRLNLEGALGPIKTYKTTSELIEDGKLVRPIVQLIKVPRDPKVDDDNLSYQEIYESCVTDNYTRNHIIFDIQNKIRKSGGNSRTLILVESLKHLKNLSPSKGIQDVFSVEGVDDLSKRYKTIDKFLNYDGPSFLLGTKIMQTGINIEEITHFINARGLKSETATLQALGRSLRLSEGVEKVYVYDFLDPYKYLQAHSKARQKSYENEGHEVKILNEE